MGKRLAVVQSSYIPWKGYFDLIRAVDEFVLLDDVQFSTNDWRNRNRIKTPRGAAWLTIPVMTSGRFAQRIQDTMVADKRWARKHWQALRTYYSRTPFFAEYTGLLEPLFDPGEDRLSAINYRFIMALCNLLGITTPVTWSTQYDAPSDRNLRLIAICQQTGATEYLSGPAARAYMDVDAFRRAGIAVRFADYDGYPEYPQPYPPFDHYVSALDLLFCTGPDATRYMKPL
jgi:WbqC-like protein family